MLMENAIDNGLDPEFVEGWLRDAEQAWNELEESQQERANELAEQHAEEAAEMFGPVVDGMIGDLSDAVTDGLADLQEQIRDVTGDSEPAAGDWEESKVALAEKKETKKKSHKHTGAYIAGGATLAAAAIGVAYMLKKKQESKGINEALMNDYVRAETI